VTVSSAGVLQLNASETFNNLYGSGDVWIQGGSYSLSVSGGSHSGVISGSGAITKVGTGVLVLSGTNTFTGGATLSGGTLQIGAPQALSTGSLNLLAGSLTSSGTTAYTLSNALYIGGTITLGDAINNGSLTFTGNGSLTASSTLFVSSPVAMTGTISGAYNLTKDGTSELLLAGTNTFGGVKTINAGTVTLQGGNAFADTLSVTINAAGLLKLNNDETIGTLAGSGSVNLQGNTLTLSGGTSTSFSGTISGTGSLIKNGNANFTLSGSEIYTGPTLINAGSLTLTMPGSLASNVITVSSGGTFNAQSGSSIPTTTVLTDNGAANLFNGTVSIQSLLGAGSITLNSTALTLDSGSFTGTIQNGTASGSVIKSGTGTLTLGGANTFSGGLTVLGGTVLAGNNAALGTGTLTMGHRPVVERFDHCADIHQRLCIGRQRDAWQFHQHGLAHLQRRRHLLRYLVADNAESRVLHRHARRRLQPDQAGQLRTGARWQQQLRRSASAHHRGRWHADAERWQRAAQLDRREHQHRSAAQTARIRGGRNGGRLRFGEFAVEHAHGIGPK
jgi:autotransporter-associated beta strand protein